MSLVHARTSEFIVPTYRKSSWFQDIVRYDWQPNPTRFTNEHTYMLVFSSSQQSLKKVFDAQKNKTITVLYEAPAAVNLYHGDDFNGNTLVIFEKKE